MAFCRPPSWHVLDGDAALRIDKGLPHEQALEHLLPLGNLQREMYGPHLIFTIAHG